jgi:predicted ATPase
MIEQPEAHLHPRYQADVADLLIDATEFGNRIIVETHSEHLLLRLQRRIAEKKLDNESVNFTYFDLGEKGTITTKMNIDKNGFFEDPVPEGFFEEGFQEAFAHVKAVQPRSDTNGENQ